MIHDIILPKLGETMEEGYLSAWRKEEGERVEKGEVLFEVMSDKTTFEVESPASGFLRKKLYEPSENPIPVTTVIGYLGDTPDEPLPEPVSAAPAPAAMPSPHEAPPAAPAPTPPAETEGRVRASPAARRLAAERGIDLSRVKGTGPGGRIEKDDVLQFAGAAPAAASAEYEVVPLTPVRRIISERLTRSKTTIPHFYLEGSVAADNLIRIRQECKSEGSDCTVTDLLIFFAAKAMAEFPLVNAAVIDGQVRLYRTIDIGLAVALEDGLIVPVIRDCAGRDLPSISAEVRRLAASARAGTLARDETENCRFVISNLGMFGVEKFLPIINPPGTAIMGVGAILMSPVVKDAAVVPAQVMHLSFSFDHRVIDGSYGARFFQRLKHLIETGDPKGTT